MMSKKQPLPIINLIYYSMQVACIVSSIAQLFIDSSVENVSATAFALIGSTILIQYLIHSGCAQSRPISTLALIGLNITSLLTSMVAMSAYGRPLIENLRAPEITFPILASVQVLAVFSHWLYTSFTPLANSSNSIATNILKPIGVFKTPHISTVWLMGFIGAFSQVLGHANTGDVGGKAIQALGFLAWMPFLIPFYYIQAGESFCNIKKQIPLVIAFIGLMILIGLARNVRQIMMIGPLQLLFAYFIFLAATNQFATTKTVQRYVSGFLGLLFAIYIATDLVTAMGVAREKRDTGTYAEVIEETFNVLFFERNRLDDYRLKTELAATLSLYDEAYIPNPVLIRLSETKFHDNMLFFGDNFISDNKGALLEGMKNRAIATLPENFVKIFDEDYNKNESIYSIGDYYLYLLWGEQRLSSFVTGSIWADFFTLFGEWYFLLVIPYLLVIFILIDSLTMRDSGVHISAIAICTSWPIFIYGIGGESLVSKAALLLREIPQRIVLYLAIFWMMYWLLGLLKIKHPEPKA